MKSRGSSRIAVGVLSLVLAGCAGDQVPVLTADPAAAVLLGTEGPAGFRYVCNDDIPFDAAPLSKVGTDEQATTADANALRKYLATPPAKADNLPASGWHLLGRAGSYAEYAIYVDSGPDAPIVRSILVKDGWQVSGADWCMPKLAVPPAVGIATWTLDPDGPKLTSETQVLTVLVQEHNCASGHGPERRIVGPVIFSADDRIQILFGVRPLDTGAATCQSVPPGRVCVDLGKAVGKRLLIDPAVWPPTTIDVGAGGSQ
jgi:hypothetical protein